MAAISGGNVGGDERRQCASEMWGGNVGGDERWHCASEMWGGDAGKREHARRCANCRATDIFVYARRGKLDPVHNYSGGRM